MGQHRLSRACCRAYLAGCGLARESPARWAGLPSIPSPTPPSPHGRDELPHQIDAAVLSPHYQVGIARLLLLLPDTATRATSAGNADPVPLRRLLLASDRRERPWLPDGKTKAVGTRFDPALLLPPRPPQGDPPPDLLLLPIASDGLLLHCTLTPSVLKASSTSSCPCSPARPATAPTCFCRPPRALSRAWNGWSISKIPSKVIEFCN